MQQTEPPIRPLHDVWLRPRRVFRELAARPIDVVDYLLGAGQGIAGFLAISRAQNAGASGGVVEIFSKALVYGSLGGIASLFFMTAIYSRLATRTGRPTTRNQVFHVMAYGGVPQSASLIGWLLTALLTGEATFQAAPRADLETFVALLLQIQFFAYVLLTLWSVLIQVMGLSEIQGLSVPKALVIWLLGQLIGFLTILFVILLIATLLPGSGS